MQPPTWPDPVDPDLLLDFQVLDTGHCLAWEHHLIQGGRHVRMACHSIAVLFRHPRHSWFLWDTGYAPRMLEATRKLPYRLYRWVTPLRLDPELAVAAQLGRFGLTPADVRQVVLSHFHADHIAGLRDFPRADLVALDSAYQAVAGRTGLKALARAFVPALLPEDFTHRARLLPGLTGPVLGALGPTHDLFGDRTALLVELPGHARGQLGLLAQARRGPIFLAADSCWLSASFRERRPPHRLTHFFIDDSAAMHATLRKLHDFAQSRPEVAIIPSHCPEALRLYGGAAS
jgi:glyoxylase-like metal-dependent hydrolase (beta-lactamase superfamily II)